MDFYKHYNDLLDKCDYVTVNGRATLTPVVILKILKLVDCHLHIVFSDPKSERVEDFKKAFVF